MKLLALAVTFIMAFSVYGETQNTVALIKPTAVRPSSLTKQEQSALTSYKKRNGIRDEYVLAIVKWTKADIEVFKNLKSIKKLEIQISELPIITASCHREVFAVPAEEAQFAEDKVLVEKVDEPTPSCYSVKEAQYWDGADENDSRIAITLDESFVMISLAGAYIEPVSGTDLVIVFGVMDW